MYFYKKGGKQVLDLRGDLVLTHNDALVKGLALAAVFVTLATVCAKLVNNYFGLDENIIWFIFVGAYVDVSRKYRL